MYNFYVKSITEMMRESCPGHGWRFLNRVSQRQARPYARGRKTMESPTSSSKVQKGDTTSTTTTERAGEARKREERVRSLPKLVRAVYRRKGAHTSARGRRRRRVARGSRKNDASTGGKGSVHADACRDRCRKQGARRLQHQFHDSFSFELGVEALRSDNGPSLLLLLVESQ